MKMNIRFRIRGMRRSHVLDVFFRPSIEDWSCCLSTLMNKILAHTEFCLQERQQPVVNVSFFLGVCIFLTHR